jgi:hypothetical protein
MNNKIFDVWADYYNRVVDFDARKDTQDHISKIEAMNIAAHLARTEIIAEAGAGIKKNLGVISSALNEIDQSLAINITNALGRIADTNEGI